ncbi:MAG: hypothetical protein IT555_13255 [Acetobacteraceae bacterium]|nr:hypothetical protein [Acetobacteraceae bacterium]
MPRLLRRLLNIVLLPLALLMVVLEDVVWAGALAVLRALRQAPPIRALDARLRSLPGYAALPLFLVPEVLGKLGEVWSIALLAGGHTVAAVEAYVLIRLVCTLIAVFIYQACEVALLRIRWFAVGVGWVHAVRAWALALMRPAVAWLRALLRRSRGRVTLRWLAIRRRLRGARRGGAR